ncbi:hypothetical protein V6N13_043435 [Hibiscus sabdariffa]
MATLCSVESIIKRLHDWGLGKIKIKRLGDKTFLISMEDIELYQMLEDLKWSYLKNIFSNIQRKRKEGEVSTQSVSNPSPSSTSQPNQSSNPREEEVKNSQESDEALNATSLGKRSLGNPPLFQTSLETGLEDSKLKGDISKKITGENRNLKEKNLKDKIHGNNNKTKKKIGLKFFSRIS